MGSTRWGPRHWPHPRNRIIQLKEDGLPGNAVSFASSRMNGGGLLAGEPTTGVARLDALPHAGEGNPPVPCGDRTFRRADSHALAGELPSRHIEADVLRGVRGSHNTSNLEHACARVMRLRWNSPISIIAGTPYPEETGPLVRRCSPIFGS